MELPPHQSVSLPTENPSKVELPPPWSVSLQAGNPAQVGLPQPRFVSLQAENPTQVELPPPRKKKRMELSSEDSGNSAALKDPQGVVRELVDVADTGEIGLHASSSIVFW